jgi:type I restriction enzyme S subunit
MSQREAILGDCVLSVSSWNPLKSNPVEEFTYVDLGSVDQQRKAVATPSRIRCEKAPSRARQLLKKGDVLVSTVRPNLNAVAIVDKSLDGATASTGFCVLRPNIDLLIPEYLFHWVKHPAFVSNLVSRATGASYPAVSDRIIKATPIPLPPVNEQKRIAAILDKADEIRRKRELAIQKLDQLAESVFIEMFGDPLSNARSHTTVRLETICDLVNGRAFKPEEWEESGIPIIRIQNLNDESKPFNYTTKAISDRFLVKTNDILFSWSGTPGTSFGCFRWTRQQGWLNQHIFRVDLTDDVNEDYFLVHMNLMLSDLISKAHGGVGLQHVTKSMVNDTTIMLPLRREQDMFSTAYRRISRLQESARDSSSKMARLIQSLQRNYFERR